MTELFAGLLAGLLAGVAIGFGVSIITVFLFLRAKFLKVYTANKDIFDAFFGFKPLPPTQQVDSVPRDLNKSSPAVSDEVMARLLRAQELTQLQNEIAAAVSAPSASAAHSKHKNALLTQYKELDKEKMNILHSILKEGHDPVITIYNTATKRQEDVKLSEFLGNYVPDVVPPKLPRKTAPKTTEPAVEGSTPRKVEKNGKTFYVIDGGKKDTNN